MTAPTAPSPCCASPAAEISTARIDASCRLPLFTLFGGAALWLVVASVFGLIASLTFHAPKMFADCAAFAYGRALPLSHSALVYGFAIPAGLGVMLASQNVGDFDYKARENMQTWFLGLIKETNSIGKLKPVLNGCKADVAAKLPAQTQGEFYLARGGEAVPLKARRSLLVTEQLPEDRILELAASTRPQT